MLPLDADTGTPDTANVGASLNRKVSKALSPTFSALSSLKMVTVGAVVSITTA